MRTALLVLVPLLAACSAVRESPSAPPTAAPPSALGPAAPLELLLPLREGSVRFAVLGDTGTGTRAQREVADMLVRYRQRFPFTFALMLGDNLYGSEEPYDYKVKFEEPYAALLGAGVTFHAALGNHDEATQTYYAGFNMDGKRYYSLERGNAEFFAVDSNYLDPEQLRWLDQALKGSDARWKIAYMHHPLYSSGDKHGPALDKREFLEPIFRRHGLALVLAGHEHFYERIKPQKGIHHFVAGGAAKLRPGSNVSEITARGFDDDYTFVLMEIAGDELFFQTLTRTGRTVDSGVITHPRAGPGTSTSR